MMISKLRSVLFSSHQEKVIHAFTSSLINASHYILVSLMALFHNTVPARLDSTRLGTVIFKDAGFDSCVTLPVTTLLTNQWPADC